MPGKHLKTFREQIQEAREQKSIERFKRNQNDEIVDAEVTELPNQNAIGRARFGNEILEIMSRINEIGQEEPPPYTGKWHNTGQQYNVDRPASNHNNALQQNTGKQPLTKASSSNENSVESRKLARSSQNIYRIRLPDNSIVEVHSREEEDAVIKRYWER